MILIPIISALLYALGGQVNKWFRWGIGLPIAAIGLLTGHGWMSLLAIPAYYLTTNIPYGENSWLNFLGEYGKFFVAGLGLGLCSFILLPFGLALSQSILSSISFVVIKVLDNGDVIKNPWVELLRGFMGTAVYFVA